MDPITPDYETVMDADASSGGESVDAAAGADTSTYEGGAASEPVDAAPAGAPAFDMSQVGEYVGQAVQQQLGPLVQALTPQPEPTVIDPFDDSFPDQLSGIVGQQLQQLLAPIMPALEAVQNQQVSQWVDGTLDQAMQTYKLPDGTDGDRQAVLYAAAGFRAVTGDDARAISAARDYMVTHDQKVGSAAVEAYKSSLRGDNGTQRDPGVNGAAIGIEPAANSYEDVVNRWNSRTSA